MKFLSVVSAAAMSISLPAAAQPAQAARSNEVCISQRALIDRAVRQMAAISASNVGDNSAPRATVSELQISNLHAEVQSRLLVMSSANCGPYTGPLSYRVYLVGALGCVRARLASTGPSREHPECVQADWTAGPEQ